MIKIFMYIVVVIASFITFGCYQISELAVNTGISKHYRDIEETTWINLQVGFLEYNKETNVFEKKICEISDLKTIQTLKNSFNIASAKSSYWGPGGLNNFMILKLENGEEWKLAFMNYQKPELMTALLQGSGAFSLNVNGTFYQQIKNYIESTQQKRIEFGLSHDDFKSYCPGKLCLYCFYDIDFGNGDFCFWVDFSKSKEIENLTSDFYFVPILSNPYIRKKLQKMGLSEANINHTFLVFNKNNVIVGRIDGNIIGNYKNNNLYNLSQLIIANKAVLLVQSQVTRKCSLVLCQNEKELMDTLTKQYFDGYTSIIYNPYNVNIALTEQ